MSFFTLAYSSALFRLLTTEACEGRTHCSLRPASAVWEDSVLVVAEHCVRRHVCVQVEFFRREGALVLESSGIPCINRPARKLICLTVSLTFYQCFSLFLLNCGI